MHSPESLEILFRAGPDGFGAVLHLLRSLFEIEGRERAVPHDSAALDQEARHDQWFLAAVMRISMRWFGFAISARTQERAGGWF